MRSPSLCVRLVWPRCRAPAWRQRRAACGRSRVISITGASEMRVYYDRDADVNLIKGKRVAIIGYGSQGHAHANNLKESGVKDVVVGLRAKSGGVAKAEAAGLKVMDPADCAKSADVGMVLTPDEGQGDL